jgi:hypothetical protein
MKEPSWQDVIDFTNRVQTELSTLIQEDEEQGITLLGYMNNAISLKHHALVEQEKEKEGMKA